MNIGYLCVRVNEAVRVPASAAWPFTRIRKGTLRTMPCTIDEKR
jgi:hypothetical protein